MPSTSISGQLAAATMSVTVAATPPKPPTNVDDLVWEQSFAGVDVQPWLIVNGLPKALPALGINASSAISIGTHRVDTDPRPPALLDVDANLRWLAVPVTLSPSGTSMGYDTAAGLWYPGSSGDESYAWSAPSGALPEGLDLGYSYDVRGTETEQPAVVFGAGQYLTLDVPGIELDALTLAMVAVLHPVPRDWFDLFSTHGDPPLKLRYFPRSVQAWTDVVRAIHDSLETIGRPVAMVLTADSNGGRLHVMERNRSSVSFDTAGVFPIALDFVLAADELGGHIATMDVIELALWTGRALDSGEVEQVFSEYDDAYRITG